MGIRIAKLQTHWETHQQQWDVSANRWWVKTDFVSGRELGFWSAFMFPFVVINGKQMTIDSRRKKNDEGRKRSNWWVTWTSNFGMVIPGDFFPDEVNSRNSEELMIERIYQSIKQWRMVAYHFPKWCLQPAGDDCVARSARWWHGGCPWNHQKLWNSYTWDIRDKVRLVFTS